MNKDLEGIVAVFDIDDTICNNKNRDYENAIVFEDMREKINNLYNSGCKIVLYTSRGMKSCNGDINKIIEKNKKVLETWLQKNKILYSELIFGKPLGDIYVDDKGISKDDFLKSDIKKLNGHSGYKVTRVGNLVKKEMSDDNYKSLMNWYKYSNGLVNNPKITSNLYSTIYMEYIDGKTASECLNEDIFKKLLLTIDSFKSIKLEGFNKEKIYKKLDSHKSETDIEWNIKIEWYKQLIKEIDFSNYSTLSHSDFILSNIIVKENDIYLIDSLFDNETSSYLFDYAKLKMSLDGYDELFCNKPRLSKNYKNILDEELKKRNIYEIVNILEIIYAIRLYRYNEDKEKVKSFVAKLEEMYV